MADNTSKSDRQSSGDPSGNRSNATRRKGVLYWIETLGNKLPHPFWMFVWICILVVIMSAITAFIGVNATHPDTGERIVAESLITGDGLRRFVEEAVRNFAHFAPFGLVLVMLMGVSIAERSGLLAVVMRSLAFAVPNRIVLPTIFILGACGNIGSDAGIVIVPPIAALIFSKMGLHPVAGLIVGYAGATAGFTANFFIAGTDVLLAGISTEVARNIDGGIEVSATANWYFMIASTIMLGLGGAFIARRFTIPRCQTFARGGPARRRISRSRHEQGYRSGTEGDAVGRDNRAVVYDNNRFYGCTRERRTAGSVDRIDRAFAVFTGLDTDPVFLLCAAGVCIRTDCRHDP
jgi:aminobenzoyl-glutamate transport protein